MTGIKIPTTISADRNKKGGNPLLYLQLFLFAFFWQHTKMSGREKGQFPHAERRLQRLVDGQRQKRCAVPDDGVNVLGRHDHGSAAGVQAVVWIFPPFWPSNLIFGGIPKDTKKPTNSQYFV